MFREIKEVMHICKQMTNFFNYIHFETKKQTFIATFLLNLLKSYLVKSLVNCFDTLFVIGVCYADNNVKFA